MVLSLFTLKKTYPAAVFVSTLSFVTLGPVSSYALDANNNGVSDVWEWQYAAEFAAPYADGDGDGSTNLEEGRLGTDPTDPASVFRPGGFSAGTGSDSFTWLGDRWTRDWVIETTDLRNWVRQGAPVQNEGTLRTMDRSSQGSSRFYSIVRSYSLNSDTDALTNQEEEVLGTDPQNWDTDGDKVPDDVEFLIGTNPLVSLDSDGDSIADDYESWCILFDANDGVTDFSHVGPGTDFDGDMVLDSEEAMLGTSPVQPLRNILFFLTEDQSIHLGLYDTNPAGGYAGDSAVPAENRTRGIETPNLDALGASGVVFDRAFCLSPVCSPSKMALYTGTFPHTNSAYRNVPNYGINFPLPSGSDPSNLVLGGVHEDLPTLIEILRDRGWFTAVSSKTHVEPIRKFPYHEGYGDLSTPGAARNAMDDVITKAGDRPFFFWASVGSPHLPFRNVPNVNGQWSPTGGLVGDGHVTNIDANAIDVPNCYPDVPGVRQDIADYLGSVQLIDSVFQACLDKLDERGILGETLVFFTSDHGIGLHRAKQSVYTAGSQVPLLIAGPGVSGAQRIREPVSHLDLAPTFLEYAGILGMPSYIGKSLWPLLSGAQSTFPDRETTFAVCHRYYNGRAVCDGRFYYIRNFSQPQGGSIGFPNPVLNADQYQGGSPWFNRTYAATVAASGSPQFELLRQIVEGDMPAEELYDLDADLWCTNNLADDPQYAELKLRLEAEMTRWMIASEDFYSNTNELTRRSGRYTPVPPVGQVTLTENFNGKSGALNSDPNWSLLIAGNGGADFSLGSNRLDAPAGSLPLAEYNGAHLEPAVSFSVSVRTGFNGQGVASGLAFGILGQGSNLSGWQFMLADGRSGAGGVNKDVRMFRVVNGSRVTPALVEVNSLQNYPTASYTQGALFKLEVSGVEGSSLVDLRIFDPGGNLYFEALSFDLGEPIPNASGFGVTAWASDSSILDDFELRINAP